MKKLVTLLVALLCFGASATQAQTFRVETGHEGPIYGLQGDFLLEGHFSVINESDENLDLKVTMLPALESGHMAYFCWDECYPPTDGLKTSNASAAVAANSVDDTRFVYYLMPNGVLGSSDVMFRFWDVNNPDNKVEVTIKFNIVVTDVEEDLASLVTMNAFPSPATAAAYISYELPESVSASNTVVEISNVFGNTLETYAIRNSKGVLPIDVTSMAPGVYFYSILVDGVRIQSRKLVVKK